MSPLLFHSQITVLLADDEQIALQRMKNALSAYPSLKIIAEVTDGKLAVEMINSLRPELVFLDIQMPGFTGLEVLEALEYAPMIVFVTAYEEYAIKAFEKNSVDYLLKPVEQQRLAVTVKRVLDKRDNEQEAFYKLKQLITDARQATHITTIPVKSGNKITLVHIVDICFFEAKDKYVYIHTADGEKMVDYSLSYLYDRLPPEFLRIHRGLIVNKLKIKEIHKYFKGTFIIVMNDAKTSRLKSAYSYYDIIRDKLLLS